MYDPLVDTKRYTYVNVHVSILYLMVQWSGKILRSSIPCAMLVNINVLF